MIVVLAILSAGLRVEEIVASNKFKDLYQQQRLALGFLDVAAHAGSNQMTYHSSHAPHIRASPPFRTEYHLGRPVLSCLDIVCEVMVHPAGVAQVCNLDTDDV